MEIYNKTEKDVLYQKLHPPQFGKVLSLLLRLISCFFLINIKSFSMVVVVSPQNKNIVLLDYQLTKQKLRANHCLPFHDLYRFSAPPLPDALVENLEFSERKRSKHHRKQKEPPDFQQQLIKRIECSKKPTRKVSYL